MNHKINRFINKQKFDDTIFSKLTDSEREFVFKDAVLTNYEKGDLIVKNGAHNTIGLFLVSGYVKLYTEDFQFKRVFDILKPYRIIGILSLYYPNIYTVTAFAITDVQILSFDKSKLSKMMAMNIEFQKFWLENLAILSNRYIQFLAFQNKKNVRGRIADVLLYLRESVYESDEFYQTLTRKEIAELANTSTETVIRIFSEFKKDHIITIDGKTITILNYDYLNQLRTKG